MIRNLNCGGKADFGQNESVFANEFISYLVPTKVACTYKESMKMGKMVREPSWIIFRFA